MEVIVASLILALLLAALANILVSVRMFVALSRNRITAAELTKYQMEQLQFNIDESAPGGLSSIGRVALQGKVIGGVNYSSDYIVSDLDGAGAMEVQRINLRTRWDSGK